MDDSIQPTYFGDSLERALTEVHPERKPLIENFLYEKSALLLYADDGVGKSVLTIQACMSATVADAKMFGEFHVPKARNVLYFQMERHPDESFERMKHLKLRIPFDNKCFALTAKLQGTNLQDPASKKEAIQKVKDTIKEIGFKPDIIAFDPIYALVVDGLETANACNSITGFFRVIQIETNCSILATSHTNRGVRDPETNKRVGKDMYGNRFLSAFFTGSYHVEAKPDGAGAVFKLDKNSQKNLEKKFGTNYDASCYLSWIDSEGKLSKKDRLDNFLKTCKYSNKEFTFAEMQTISELSDSTLRGYLCGYLKDSIQEFSTAKKGKIIYKYV